MKKRTLKNLKNLKKENKNLVTEPTWLPLFSGFYHSFFDCSDSYIDYEASLSEDEFKEYYSELHEAGVTQDFFNSNLYNYINYEKCNNGAAEYIADALINLDHSDIIKEVIYEKIVSPKYYNFSTDSINCDIKYDQKKLLKYLDENKENFENYISGKYTSCSGFSSSYSNDVDSWLDVDSWGSHEVGSLLQFVFENNGVESIDLYYESNCEEGFRNELELDYEKIIKDFRDQKQSA